MNIPFRIWAQEYYVTEACREAKTQKKQKAGMSPHADPSFSFAFLPSRNYVSGLVVLKIEIIFRHNHNFTCLDPYGIQSFDTHL